MLRLMIAAGLVVVLYTGCSDSSAPKSPTPDTPEPATDATSAKQPRQDAKGWRNDLSALVNDLVGLAGSAKVPSSRDLNNSFREKMALLDKNGNAIWILDLVPGDGELRKVLTDSFKGEVSWTGTVKSVEPDDAKDMYIIDVAMPLPAKPRENCEFEDSVTLSVPKKAISGGEVPVVGSTLSFDAQLKPEGDEDIFGPVWVLYGVGSLDGKIKIGVSPVEPRLK